MDRSDVLASLRGKISEIENKGAEGANPSHTQDSSVKRGVGGAAQAGASLSPRKSCAVSAHDEANGTLTRLDHESTGRGDASTSFSRGASKPEDNARGANEAFSKIVAMVNASEKSARTVRERLARAGFGEGESEEALAKAISYGIVDDARFADILIRSRIVQGKGSAGIERELRKNGIDPDTCPGWPYDYDVDSESELARALDALDRKPPRSKNVREGAYRRLMQRGFPSSVASSAARIWSSRAADGASAAQQ